MKSEEVKQRQDKLKRLLIAFGETFDQTDGSYNEKLMEEILSFVSETYILAEIDNLTSKKDKE